MNFSGTLMRKEYKHVLHWLHSKTQLFFLLYKINENFQLNIFVFHFRENVERFNSRTGKNICTKKIFE